MRRNKIAIALSLIIMASIVCSCSTNIEETETIDTEVVEESCEESAEESYESTAVTIIETEAEVTPLPSLTPASPQESLSEEMYYLLIDYVRDYHYSHSDSNIRYTFTNYISDGCNYPSLCIGTEGSHTYDRYIVEDSEVRFLDEITFDGAHLTYYEIIQLPYANEEIFWSAVNSIDSVRLDSYIPNGTYYGEIYAISLDGRRVLAIVGDLADITNGEYCTLEPSDISICNQRLLLINIDRNCYIEDTFIWLYDSIEDDASAVDIATLPYNDGPNNFSNTVFFHHALDNSYYLSYNGWFEALALMEPVTIENNVITNVRLGWR